ncbi:hypothetical protein FES52_15600 [Escherichia coli]|nr:hypothetical protein [Escherichia coli]
MNRVRKIEFINDVNNFQTLSRTKEQILISDADVYLAAIITASDYYGQIIFTDYVRCVFRSAR